MYTLSSNARRRDSRIHITPADARGSGDWRDATSRRESLLCHLWKSCLQPQLPRLNQSSRSNRLDVEGVKQRSRESELARPVVKWKSSIRMVRDAFPARCGTLDGSLLIALYAVPDGLEGRQKRFGNI